MWFCGLPPSKAFRAQSPPSRARRDAKALIADLEAGITTTRQDTERNLAACEGSKAIYYDQSREMRFNDHLLSVHLRDVLRH